MAGEWETIGSVGSDQTAPVLNAPGSEPKLGKTIADINAGKPAPQVNWKGSPVPEYQAPVSNKGWETIGAVKKDEEPSKKSFIETLRNPIDLWTKESLPAHVYNAYQKGTFGKPIGELVKSAREDVKNFSFTELVDAAKKNPGEFAGELVNSIVADPELLFAPMGLGGKVAASLAKAGSYASDVAKLGITATKVVTKGAALTGRVGESAVVGGGTMAAISGGKQLDEAGYIDPRQIVQDTKAGAAMGAAMVVGINLGSAVLKIKPSALWEKVRGEIENGKTPEQALDTGLGSFGATKAERKPYTDAMREQGMIEEANALHSARAQGLPEPDAKLSKREQARRTKEATARVKTESEGAAIVAEDARLNRQPTQQLLDAISTESKVDAPASGVENFNTSSEIKALEAKDLPILKQGAVSSDAAKWADIEQKAKAVGLVSTGKGSFQLAMRERGFVDPDFVRLAAMEGKVKPGQGGQANPTLLRKLALAGVSAGIGGYLADDPKQGALIGGLLAVGGMGAARGARIISENMGNRLGRILGKDTRYRIDDIRRDYQSTLAGMKIDIARVGKAAERLIPDEARRSEMTHFIETGKAQYAPKTSAEVAYVKLINDSYKKLGDAGQQSGVLTSLIPEGSYITHLFGITGPELDRAKNMFSNMNASSKFAMHRTFPTMEVAMANGFKPITLDSAKLFQIYGDSISKSIANKLLIDALKGGQHPDGRGLLIRAKDAPADYVSVLHPQLQWAKVNPEIAPSMQLLFSADNPNAISQALLNMSAVAKRSLFSFSMFHGMALTEAALAAQPSLAKGVSAVGTTFGRAITGKHWLEGEFGRNAEDAARAGVVLEPHKGIDAESDIFNKMLTNIIEGSSKPIGRAALGMAGAAVGAAYADDPFSGALAGAALGLTGGRKAVQGARWLDTKLNTLLWDKLHPTFKIITFQNQKEALLAKNVKLANKGQPTLTPQQIDRYAASFTNDIFGGQNWIELAEGVQNKFGRDIAMAAVSPAGRRGLSIGLLAPDWTISTVRSIAKAIPGVSEKEIGAMHRAYVARSALAYLTMGDGLNLMFSGHHLWENEDPTYIDLGDGRKMQLNKHFMETFHWLQHPGKTFSNKLGLIPSMAGKIAYDPYMRDPGAIAKELVKHMTPIPATNITTQGEMGASSIAGAFGLPIYGKTAAQKEQARLKKEERKDRIAEALQRKADERKVKKEREE